MMLNNYEKDYTALLDKVLAEGTNRESRVGPTKSLFGAMLTIDALEHGYFPVLTQRKLFLGGILGELAAFLRGATDLQTFKDFKCNYWDANAAAWAPNKGVEPGKQYVGRIYGSMWRAWIDDTSVVDQLQVLIDGLKTEPNSRRHLLTTYNPAQLDEGCLPPCHLLAQYNVRGGKLDCIVYMRSVDLCLGLPSDVVLYATLLLILCGQVGLTPGKLTFMLGDTHIYHNHMARYTEYKSRQRKTLPTFKLAPCTIDTFTPDAFHLINYQHSGVLAYELNV